MKIHLRVGLFFLALCWALGSPTNVFAYKTHIHSALAEDSVFLYNHYYKERMVKSGELESIMSGAVKEDAPPRWFNHYYDPVNNKGLDYLLRSWPSAKKWSQDGDAQSSILYNSNATFDSIVEFFGREVKAESDFTWQRALDDYMSGDKARAFEGLGHILHLIQDVTVPAHTRNDAHPGFGSDKNWGGADPYEDWTGDKREDLIDIFSLLKREGEKPIVLSTLNNYFLELATYTNGHFYSADSIGEYLMPSISSPKIVTSGLKRYQLLTDLSGDYAGALLTRSDFIARDFAPTDFSVNDTKVSGLYWDRLSKKAVQYGAGVINLFFEEIKRREAEVGGGRMFSSSVIDNLGVSPKMVHEPMVEPSLEYEQGEKSENGEVGDAEPDSVIDSGALSEQLNRAEGMVDDLAVQIGEMRAKEVVVGEVLAESVDAEPVWTPSIVYGTLVQGGGGVQSDPGIMVDEEILESEVSSASLEVLEESEDSVEKDEVEVVIDDMAPGGITTLGILDIRDVSLTLIWQAVGDDDDVGIAEGYDIRRSFEEITEDNWESQAKVDYLGGPKSSYEDESLSVDGLEPDTEYYFAVRAFDEEGNLGEISNIVSGVTLPLPLKKILISEVFIDMRGADDSEFIELYNPNDEEVSLEEWSLQYLSGSAEDFSGVKKKNFEEDASIGAKGFYLVGMKNYEGGIEPDMRWSQSLNNTGASVLLVAKQDKVEEDSDSLIVDRLAYGSGDGLLLSEASLAALPGEGYSLERRPEQSGTCIDLNGESEFWGNGCDKDNNEEDFVIREEPTPQNSDSFIEPRKGPDKVEADFVFYNNEKNRFEFLWDEVLDWRGLTDRVSFLLKDISEDGVEVELMRGADKSFDYGILEINRDYVFSVQAIDAEGLGSEIVEAVVSVPSYLSTVEWYFAGLDEETDEEIYRLHIGWDEYPFVPVYIPHSALGKLDKWHVVIFTYNNEPFGVSAIGPRSDYGWGDAIGMEDPLWVTYDACKGSRVAASGVIFPDTPDQCISITGWPINSALDAKFLGDGELTLEVSERTFEGGSGPQEGDYLTLSYYTYHPQSNPSSDQRLVAVDKTKYYLDFSEGVGVQ